MISTRSVGAVVFAVTLSTVAFAALGDTANPPGAPQIRSDDATAETLRRGDAYAHLIAAGLAVSRGRGSEAAHELDQAVALEPDSPGLLAQGASLLSMLGRRTEADRLARRALEIDKNQLEAVRVLADLATSRSFGPKSDPAARAEAIRLYERLAIEDKTAQDEVWSSLARLKLASGDGDGAVADAHTLLVRRPDDEGALRLLDQCFVAAGRTKEALETTLDWVKAHPDSSDEMLPLIVEMARETRQWALIESMCDGILKSNADNVRARALRGEARLRQGRPREALDDLEIARAASQDDPMVRLHIAAAYQALNRLADATQVAKSLASEYPDNTFVRVLLAETLVRRGENAAGRVEYVAALHSLAGDDPEDSARRDEIRVRIASIDLTAKRCDDARAMLAALEKPDAPDMVAMRARGALACGDPKEAKRLAKLLATAQPVDGALIDGEADLTLGRASRADGRFEAAIAKGGAAARGDVAIILRRNGRDAEAEKQLRAWVNVAPTDPEGRLALGALLERTGRIGEAEVELREAIRLDPRSAEALNYLGYSFADRNERLDEALALIKSALQIDPWNGAYLDSLGWVYVKLGRLDDARDPLERAAREFPRDPTVLEHLGDYYDRTGDIAKAKTYWQRALDEFRETPESADEKESLQKKLDKVPVVAGPPGNQAAVVTPETVKRLLLGFCGLAALACAQSHRSDRVPEGTGPLIAVYKTSIDDGHEVSRGAKLAVWAQRPDRLHAEIVAPVGGVAYILDAGDGNACVVDIAAATAYVGRDGPGAIEAFAGVRVSVADAVAALLDGVSPAGLTVTRVGGAGGALPKRLRIDDGARSLSLDRVRFERGRSNPAALGTGTPPAELSVQPLANLDLGRARKTGLSGGDR